MPTEYQVKVITSATVAAGSVLKANDTQKLKLVHILKLHEHEIAEFEKGAHTKLGRSALLTIRSALRYIQTGKKSDSKLVVKNGHIVAAEFGRLKRAAYRREGNTNGN
ncbi:MAG: hypothetical protein RR588_02035 [Solibacillus sp.]